MRPLSFAIRLLSLFLNMDWFDLMTEFLFQNIEVDLNVVFVIWLFFYGSAAVFGNTQYWNMQTLLIAIEFWS